MKDLLKYFVSACVLLSPLAAQSADLAVKAPPPAAAAVYNWTGLYIGVNGGWAWGQQDPLDLLSTRFDRSSFDINGGMVGGTIGAQIQQGYILLGVEGDLDWADISGSGTTPLLIGGAPIPGFPLTSLNVTTKIDAIGTARLRAGVALNNWLLYTTAGVAFLHESANGTTIAGVPCGTLGVLTSCSDTHWRPGVAVGLGTEYAFTPNWSLKGEYLYVAAVGTGASKDTINLLRFGVNYKF
jgi:outer membrane immunogenic protein